MPLKHAFPTLACSGLDLLHDEANAAYAHWLVVARTDSDCCLYDETNIDALVAELTTRHGFNAAEALISSEGEYFAVIHPGNSQVLATAIRLAADIAVGQHLDTGLYNEAMDDAAEEHWRELAIPQRIALLQSFRLPVALSLEKRPGLDLMRCLYELIDSR